MVGRAPRKSGAGGWAKRGGAGALAIFLLLVLLSRPSGEHAGMLPGLVAAAGAAELNHHAHQPPLPSSAAARGRRLPVLPPAVCNCVCSTYQAVAIACDPAI